MKPDGRFTIRTVLMCRDSDVRDSEVRDSDVRDSYVRDGVLDVNYKHRDCTVLYTDDDVF